MNRSLALLTGLAAVLLAWSASGEEALGAAVLVGICLSMILRPGWWTFWLPFGLLEQLARDRHMADHYEPVIILLGWVALLLLLLLVWV